MSGFCEVVITGYASKDAELKTTAGGKQLCTWSVATGNKEFTQWHNLQAWGETAQLASTLKKGDKFKAVGTIQYNKYKDKIYTNIVVFKLELVASTAKKVGDTVIMDGEVYEVVPDASPADDEELPF